jgi:hypothetical protein
MFRDRFFQGGAVAAVLAGACLLSACATARPSVGPPAASNPRRTTGTDDLGVAGRGTPALLKLIGLHAYALDADATCQSIAEGIAEIDAVLGPDIDLEAESDQGSMPGRYAMNAVRGAIPYRWVLRLMTGADKRDRAYQAAVLTGVARRAFLKGVRKARSCP